MEIIHIVLGKANPNRMNGVNKVVNSLATYQTELGHKVTVWGLTFDLQRNFPDRNYKTLLFQASKNKLKLDKHLMQEIKACSNDTIFHLHGGFIPEFYLLAKAIKRCKFEFLFTPHGAYNVKAMEKSKWTKKVYYSLFERAILKRAKAIHCIGESEVKALEHLNKKLTSVLIPNGQNIEELQYKKISLERRNFPVFGFCGRIDIHTKGLDHLLNGFAEFTARTGGSGELWIIGGGGELVGLKRMAQNLGISRKVKFWGKRFGAEKLNIMAQMDVFFHPSRNEGLPGAVLEAAGLGVPCVVSRESNMSEAIKQYAAGIGLRSNNAKEVAKAMGEMNKLSKTEGLKQQKANAIKMISEQFNWNRIATQLVNAYQQ